MASTPRSSMQYAQLVIDAPFDDEVRALIDKCPAEWRASVELLVASHERRVAEFVRQKEKLRLKRLTTTPEFGTYQDPAPVRGNPVIAARSMADIRSVLKPLKDAR